MRRNYWPARAPKSFLSGQVSQTADVCHVYHGSSSSSGSSSISPYPPRPPAVPRLQVRAAASREYSVACAKMGTRAPAYENNGTGRSNSKKHIRKHSSSSQLGNVGSLLRVCRTSSRGLLGALILATLVGCATIALQLAVSGHGGVRHARLNARAEGDAGDGVVPPPLIYDQSAAPRGGDYMGNMDSSSSSSSSSSSKDTPNRSREGKEGTTTRTTGGYPTREAIGPPEPLNPMKNQHRFGGQRTGASAKAEQGPGEAVYHLPGYSGPFGWGTDWSLSVSVEEGGEDVIEPARCKTDPAERSFVDYVMERRGEASPQVGGTTTRNTKNKVRCIEWVLLVPVRTSSYALEGAMVGFTLILAVPLIASTTRCACE